MTSNLAIIAAAGARKTQRIVESALACGDDPVLITTYTIANQREIVSRIEEVAGRIPPNVSVLGWFAFLICHGARPYQRALTESANVIQGLNFHGRRNRYARKSDVHGYFLDSRGNLYRDEAASFVCEANRQSNGRVVARLERVFAHIFVDEVQDLTGYDLDILTLLFRSSISITVVGDPRQGTLRTNLGQRNKSHRGHGILDWLRQQGAACRMEVCTENYRCNQAICDFGDALFPDYPQSTSMVEATTGHDGVFLIPRTEALDYFERWQPQVLRNDKREDALGLPAINFGVAKGRSFARVMIFPTAPIRKYLLSRDPTNLRAPERLYVAVTRARHSVAFVVS